MQVLSNQEINQVSGAFSATKILNSAETGLLFVAVVGVCFGGGWPTFPAFLQGAAIFGGVTLAHEGAEWFDEHYGTPAKTQSCL